MRVAIIGCGQLARMLALAGLPLGLKFSFVADHGIGTDTACVDGLGLVVPWQKGDSETHLYQQLGNPDLVTVEKEQVDLDLLKALEQFCPIRPNVMAVEKTKNRFYERQLLASLAIPTADFSFGEGLLPAAQKLGYPLVLKSIDEGYDGKNQWRLNDQQEIASFLHEHPAIESNILSEQWIDFDRELSLVAVRGLDGKMGFYPLTENVHRGGILHRSIAPAANIHPDVLTAARDYLRRVMVSLEYVGVMAMELFETSDGLLVNELAPRVHNSGHWTQSGSVTCQFENHLRAITGLPLGSTACLGVTGMLNLVGTPAPPMQAISYESTLNWYNKKPKPGRKLGHVNFFGSSREQVLQAMDEFETTLPKKPDTDAKKQSAQHLLSSTAPALSLPLS